MPPALAGQLRGRYDLVVIDSPPSVHETIKAVATAMDLAIIPAGPRRTIWTPSAPSPAFFTASSISGSCKHRCPASAASTVQRPWLCWRDVRPCSAGRLSGRPTRRPPATGETGYETDAAAREEIGALYGMIRERLDMKTPEKAITRQGIKVPTRKDMA